MPLVVVGNPNGHLHWGSQLQNVGNNMYICGPCDSITIVLHVLVYFSEGFYSILFSCDIAFRGIGLREEWGKVFFGFDCAFL